MKYFKWFFIIAVCFIAFIMLAEAEDHTKQTWTIVGFIAWLYWLLKESIEEKALPFIGALITSKLY